MYYSRRELLTHAGLGLGSLALCRLLVDDNQLGAAPRPELNGGLHHRAKAKRVIQLFMNGGASQMDLFDYKPQLQKLHGQKFDPGTSERVEAATSAPGNVLGSPFKWAQHGQCGRWVSEQLPHTAKHVDELAILLGMQSKTNVHGPASYLMNTGFLLPGFPSFGAWVSYGLGSLTENLPTFVVLPDRAGCRITSGVISRAGSSPSRTKERSSTRAPRSRCTACTRRRPRSSSRRLPRRMDSSCWATSIVNIWRAAIMIHG